MTTPAPAPALFPDIEAVLVSWLPGQLSSIYGVNVRVLTETPDNLGDILPVVAVSRSAGVDIQAILDRPVADIDVFASTRTAASLLSRQCHILLHGYLPGTVIAGAVIGMVNTVKGPGWLPYQDLDFRRYNATYEIYTHPAPA